MMRATRAFLPPWILAFTLAGLCFAQQASAIGSCNSEQSCSAASGPGGGPVPGPGQIVFPGGITCPDGGNGTPDCPYPTPCTTYGCAPPPLNELPGTPGSGSGGGGGTTSPTGAIVELAPGQTSVNFTCPDKAIDCRVAIDRSGNLTVKTKAPGSMYSALSRATSIDAEPHTLVERVMEFLNITDDNGYAINRYSPSHQKLGAVIKSVPSFLEWGVVAIENKALQLFSKAWVRGLQDTSLNRPGLALLYRSPSPLSTHSLTEGILARRPYTGDLSILSHHIPQSPETSALISATPSFEAALVFAQKYRESIYVIITNRGLDVNQVLRSPWWHQENEWVISNMIHPSEIAGKIVNPGKRNELFIPNTSWDWENLSEEVIELMGNARLRGPFTPGNR